MSIYQIKLETRQKLPLSKQTFRKCFIRLLNYFYILPQACIFHFFACLYGFCHIQSKFKGGECRRNYPFIQFTQRATKRRTLKIASKLGMFELSEISALKPSARFCGNAAGGGRQNCHVGGSHSQLEPARAYTELFRRQNGCSRNNALNHCCRCRLGSAAPAAHARQTLCLCPTL